MKAKKSRVVLSSVSVLLVLSLLAGMTMAWFTDTEKVNANFTAGVLDISVKPGETDVTDLTFENLRPMLYDNFYKELEPNGNEKWVNDVTPVSYTHLKLPRSWTRIPHRQKWTRPRRICCRRCRPCARRRTRRNWKSFLLEMVYQLRHLLIRLSSIGSLHRKKHLTL